MTFKEAIIDNLQTCDMSEFVLCSLITSISIMLLADSHQRLLADNPNVTIADEMYEGKRKENPTLQDYVSVMNGDDLLRHLSQNLQFTGFMKYLYEQEIPEEIPDDLSLWYSPDFIGRKWNEYARIARTK